MQVVALLTIVTISYLNLAHARWADIDDIPQELEPEDPCKDLTYCTVKPKDYPQEKFNKMFKGYKVLPQPSLVPEITFDNRIGESIEVDNCRSIVEYAPLYKIREKRQDPWRIVVQVPGINFTQTFRTETCENPEAKCFTAYATRMDIVTLCKQKHQAWEVLVAKGDNETEKIKPMLPICCSCHYKPVEFIQRFGGRS